MSDLSFLLIQVGHKCSDSMKANFGSLSRQTFKSWRLVFVDDHSEDDTSSQVDRYSKIYGLHQKVSLITSTERKGLLAHTWEILKDHLHQSTHVILLFGVHRFSHDRALERIAKEHSKGWAVVWGKWRDRDGNINESGALHPYEDLRQQPWVFGGPLSFNSKYLKNLTKKDLQGDQEDFLLKGGIQAFGYILCESTIKRRYLKEIICTYDQVEPAPYDEEGIWRDELMDEDLKHAIHTLADRESKELRVDQTFFREHIYEFMEMAFLGERHLSRRELSSFQVRQNSGFQTQKIKDFMPNSSIAASLTDNEDVSDLTPEEQKERLLRMDIEDAEMMAEAGFYKEALAFFEELAEHDPESSRIHTNIGVLHWNLEESQVGMKHFMLALRYDRENRDPVMNCAGAWAELGHIEQAKQICKTFLITHPDDHPVKDLLQELETLNP